MKAFIGTQQEIKNQAFTQMSIKNSKTNMGNWNMLIKTY